MSKSHHLGSKSAHSAPRDLDDVNWNDVRVFLALAEVRSFREAAKILDLSIKALRARLEAFERQLGWKLFLRSARGLELTPEGVALRQNSEEMYNGARRLMASLSQPKHAKRSVKIGCTEGLGAFWIMPRLLELVEREHNLNIYLNCETSVQDVANLAVDFAIQFERPTNPDLIVTRLCWLHVVLFASKGYVEKHGRPRSKAEIDHHNLLEISGAQIWSHALRLDEHEKDRDEFVRISTNTASAQLIAVKRGGGITAIPTYSETITHGLVHVAEDWILTRDVWLVCNPQVMDQLMVRKCINYMKHVFDPARFPWFRQEYIPPAEIRRFIEEKNLQSLFEGYSDYTNLPPDPEHDPERARQVA